MHKKITWYLRLASYFYPIPILYRDSDKNKLLQIKLFRNEWMLSCGPAIYSMGTTYTPFVKSFARLLKKKKNISSFLLLGTGLGSALHILHKKYNIYPNAVLVEIDEEIIGLSRTYMEFKQPEKISWICADAITYMKENTQVFDVIGIDIFTGLHVPFGVQQTDFLSRCKLSLNPDGVCIINFIGHTDRDIKTFEATLHEVFSNVDIIKEGLNRFYIAN